MLHADVLAERAKLTPSKLALVDVATGARLTYEQLDARASAAANVLVRDLRLTKGDRLALLAGNSPAYVDLFFAAARTGVVLVPLNTRLTAHELAHIVNDATPHAFIHSDGFGAIVDALKPRVAVEAWASLDDVSAARAGEPFGRVACDGEDLCCLLYTSGTTGLPKGVRIPHRMLAWNAYNTAACWGLREDDVCPLFTPLYHAGGLAVFLLPLMVSGGTTVLHRVFDVAEVWRVIEQEGCTIVFGVPTIFQLLMDAPAFGTADLSRIRWFISGGAPLPQYIIDAYQRRGVVFKQGYGLTEVGVNCFAMTIDDSVRKKGSIGKPMMFTAARLIDGAGHDVGTDEVGELLLRGPHVCQGYWNNPAATAESLDGDGWFHTGDLARRDAEGFFYIAGRRKDMFISGGVNVYPAEVEAALLLHPALRDAAVIGVPHDTWGEVGLAFVVVRDTASVTPGELSAHLEQRIARYKVPKAYRFVASLPRTAYGKVVKTELRKAYDEEIRNERLEIRD